MSVNSVQKKLQREPIDLSGANLRQTNLSHTNLSKANLSKTNLLGVNLEGADLSNANLSESKLAEANLSFANLSGADFSSADLARANLVGAKLKETNFDFASFPNTCVKATDLSGASGLSWHNILDMQVDEKTIVPDYLKEENLFDELEQLNPHYSWRKEFSGNLSSLFHEFSKLNESNTGDTIYSLLIKMRIHHEDSDEF